MAEDEARQARLEGLCRTLAAVCPQPHASADPVDVGVRRRQVAQPLLDARGLTPTAWARHARPPLDPSVAFDYLAGRRKTRRDTRARLGAVLGLPADAMPD
jgi:hypothetical protein